MRPAEPTMRLHSLPYTKVKSPEALLEAGPSRVFEFMPSMNSAAPPPLPSDLGATDAIAARHIYAGPVPPIEVYAVSGHVIGGGGMLRRDGSVLFEERILPEYYRRAIVGEWPSIWEKGLFNPDAKVIESDVPVAMALSPNQVYGHFLLEMLPKLWVIARLHDMGIKCKVAITRHDPPWVGEFCRLLVSADNLLFYDPDTEVVRAPTVLMPSLIERDYTLHPAMNLVVEHLRSKLAATKSGRCVWLSRRRMEHEGRGLTNVSEIESVLVAAGFDIIHPQQMTIAEQLRTFSDCAILAGEYGSGLHNAMFMPRASAVIGLNPVNYIQSRIAALRQQQLCLVPSAGGEWKLPFDGVRNRRFSVDLDVLRRAVHHAALWVASH